MFFQAAFASSGSMIRLLLSLCSDEKTRHTVKRLRHYFAISFSLKDWFLNDYGICFSTQVFQVHEDTQRHYLPAIPPTEAQSSGRKRIEDCNSHYSDVTTCTVHVISQCALGRRNCEDGCCCRQRVLGTCGWSEAEAGQ